jgi:hypothetical protein
MFDTKIKQEITGSTKILEQKLGLLSEEQRSEIVHRARFRHFFERGAVKNTNLSRGEQAELVREFEKEVEDNFQEFFGNNLNNILITLANVNWCFKWERLNVTYNLGCLTYVLNKNIEQSEKYELTNVNRTKKLFTVNNEPRGTRLYFYKYIIDNNLLDNFDCSFFFKFQDKQQITWDNVEGGGDTLQALKDVFPVITFDNENNDDYYKKIKIINFPKVTDSYVDVVIETSLFDKNFYSFSEKSFKSIIAKKPFVILGSNSTYKGLKELGFQTYDDLIDVRQLEDGFKEWQFKERIDYFFKSVHKLCDKDLEYYKNYYILNKDKIEYNYKIGRASCRERVSQCV